MNVILSLIAPSLCEYAWRMYVTVFDFQYCIHSTKKKIQYQHVFEVIRLVLENIKWTTNLVIKI